MRENNFEKISVKIRYGRKTLQYLAEGLRNESEFSYYDIATEA